MLTILQSKNKSVRCDLICVFFITLSFASYFTEYGVTLVQSTQWWSEGRRELEGYFYSGFSQLPATVPHTLHHPPQYCAVLSDNTWQCRVQSRVKYIVQCRVQCRLQCIVQCRGQCTVQCRVQLPALLPGKKWQQTKTSE